VQAKDCVKENANNVRRVPSGCPIRSGVGRLAVAAPGLLAALGIAWLGGQLAQGLGRALFVLRGVDPAGRASPISAISMAVLLGILLANTVRLPALLQPGLDLARKRVLRLGIVLIGLKLSVLDVIRVGAVGLPVVIVLVTFAFAISLWLARRLAVSRELGSLAAASTAICGITATLAVAPVVRADDREVAYTVANVTLIGLLGMLVYPYVAHALFGDSSLAAGLFLGTSIHDTSQVMGAALTYAGVRGDERALQIATITKLTRNALLVAVIPALAVLASRATGTRRGERRPLRSYFPTFVLAFVALSLLRTFGDLGLEHHERAFGLFTEPAFRKGIQLLADRVAPLALGMALAAVGVGTRLSILRGLGWRPLAVGFGAAVAVGCASAILSALIA